MPMNQSAPPVRVPDRKPVAEWWLAPLTGYECLAFFFEDCSGEFLDEPARHRESDGGNNGRKLSVMMHGESERQFAEEICRHTRAFKVPLDLLRRVVSAQGRIRISDDGEVLSNIPPDEEAEIDRKLLSIFWRDVNPLLTSPLSQE